MKGIDTSGTSFPCSVCGKESASDAANKRHIRYCRRKSATGPRSRAKSCQACMHAKTRCELDFTGCERCTQKDLACSLTPTLSSLDENGDGLLPLDDFGTGSAPGQVTSQDALPGGLNTGEFPWQLFGASATDSFGIDNPSGSPRQLLGRMEYYTPSAMMASTMGYGILGSYPSLMQDRNNLPPSIHPFCYGSEEDDWAFPESLATAVAITSRDARDADTISQIRREQHRIASSLLETGVEDLLSSLQAVILYTLMRIAGGPSSDPEDVHLCQTLTHLCGRIPSLPGIEAQLDRLQPWRRWIVIETKRRINSVVRLLWLLYHVDVGLPHPCHRTAWTSSPLPASKTLWKASTEGEWEAARASSEFYKSLSPQNLLYFKGCTDVDGQPSREEWARWYAGADELGIVVVIAASLV